MALPQSTGTTVAYKQGRNSVITVSGYPPQEPFSPAAKAYHDRVMGLGAGVKDGEEVAYGTDPYQRLLIYRTDDSTSAILAFFHGGGWTNGYKEWMTFMAPAVTGAGITFVSIGYRLAPAHVFPTGLEDCAEGLLVTHQSLGFAPLFVGGHSAGGHYAALLAVRNEWWRARRLNTNPLRGCLPISGVYLFGEGSGLSIRPRFLGPTDGHERAASPMMGISDRTPFLMAYGDHDFPHLIAQAANMSRALESQGNPVEVIVLPGCDHFDASYQAAEPRGVWLQRAVSFIARYQYP